MKKRIFSALAMVLAFALVFTGMGKTTKASAHTYRHGYYDYYWWFWGWDDDYKHEDNDSTTVFKITFMNGRNKVGYNEVTATWKADYDWNDAAKAKGAFYAEVPLLKTFEGIEAGYEVKGWKFDSWEGEGKYPLLSQRSSIDAYANYKEAEFTGYAVLDLIEYTIVVDGKEMSDKYKMNDEVQLPTPENFDAEKQTITWSFGQNGVYTVNPSDADEKNIITITSTITNKQIEQQDGENNDENDKKDGENENPVIEPIENKDNGDNNNDNRNDYTPVVPMPVVEEKVEEVVEEVVETETPEAPVEEEVEEEIEVVEEVEETIDTTVPETPEADASLPQTGVAPASLFYGMGAAIIALGGAMIIFGRRKQF